MADPTVCAVMLTRDRPAMARRAMECFMAQTYRPLKMLVLDTGERLIDTIHPSIGRMSISRPFNHTIGSLRNIAVGDSLTKDADIIVTWDDDDWSHPNRIAEQVALLQSSGADCVAYRELLFWRETSDYVSGTLPAPVKIEEMKRGAAWRYKVASPSCGSTFCYWRKAWEKRPFPNVQHGEDVLWRREIKVIGATAMLDEPRMICQIHGGNTETYDPAKYPDTWSRVPQWDEYCWERMTL